jgi:DNA ligase-associated metallophosphoesterase
MSIVTQSIQFANQELILCNKRVVYWPKYQALLLSDLHLGKSGHFRKNGIAVTNKISIEDIKRLKDVLEFFYPKDVYIIGDLVHANYNKEWILFQNLIHEFKDIKIHLIKGNHDKISYKTADELCLYAVNNEIKLDNILLTHQPSPNTNMPNIYGHIHPGIRIKMMYNKYITYPCFMHNNKAFVLPAFSTFTGCNTMYKLGNDVQYYIFDEAHIIKY